MYGTGKAERVTRGTIPLACFLAYVSQGTGQDRTGGIHQWTALNDDMRNGWGRTRDVRHPSRFDE